MGAAGEEVLVAIAGVAVGGCGGVGIVRAVGVAAEMAVWKRLRLWW